MAGRGHAHHPGFHGSQKQRWPYLSLQDSALGHSFPSGAGLQLLRFWAGGVRRLGQGSPGERGLHRKEEVSATAWRGGRPSSSGSAPATGRIRCFSLCGPQGLERCLCSQLWGPPESPMNYVPGWQGIWETQTERVPAATSTMSSWRTGCIGSLPDPPRHRCG